MPPSGPRGASVTYRGRAVTSYFFAASGGHTENVEDSFVGSSPKPWLKGVPDPYDAARHAHLAPRPVHPCAARREAGRLGEGQLERVVVTRRGASPRIVRAVVVGTRGARASRGPTSRRAWACPTAGRRSSTSRPCPRARGRRWPPRSASAAGSTSRRATCAVRGTISAGAPGASVAVQAERRGAGTSRRRQSCGAAAAMRRCCRARAPTACATTAWTARRCGRRRFGRRAVRQHQ